MKKEDIEKELRKAQKNLAYNTRGKQNQKLADKWKGVVIDLAIKLKDATHEEII